MLVTNYLFKNLFKTTMFITIVITLVVLLTQSLRLIELIASNNAPAYIFLKMFILTLPKLFEIVLPISLAITTLFIYNKMIMDNEIVVMSACGFSRFQLAKPVLVIGAAATLLLMLFSLWLTPASVNAVKQMRFDVRTKYSSFLVKEGVFNTFSDDLTVYVREKLSTGKMQGIMIHDNRDKDKPPVTITAKSGQIVTDIGDYPVIVVYNGMRQQLDEKTDSLTKLYFTRYSIEIKGLNGKATQRWRKEDERSFIELFNPDTNNQLDMKFKDIFIAEAHKRIVSPLNALSFTVLSVAFVMFGSFNRRGNSKKIAYAVMSIVFFQALTIVFLNTAKTYPWVIPFMYINVFVPIGFGALMLSHNGEKLIYSLIGRKYSKVLIDNMVEE